VEPQTLLLGLDLTIYFLAACMTNVCDLAKHHTRLASSYILDFVRVAPEARSLTIGMRFPVRLASSA
jgi:hypothetical protein